jgi:hypothetical protein
MATLPLAEFLGISWLFWWQLPLLALLILLIIFWRIYRSKQM